MNLPAEFEEKTTTKIPKESGVLGLIQAAVVSPDVDVEKMNALLDMQERILDKNANVAYHAAMAEMQSEMPEITKSAKIVHKGQTISNYARFEDINAAIKPILAKHGFSVSFRSNFVDGQLEVTGIVSHKEGHHEETTMRLPFDNSGAKNNVQAIGSSVSYGKRYVLCMLLNISTADIRDDDGNAAGTQFVTAEQAADLHSLVEGYGFKHEDVWKHYKISSYEEVPASKFGNVCKQLEAKAKKSANN
jgi:hypothetical protein